MSRKHFYVVGTMLAAAILAACQAYDPAVRMGRHGAIGTDHRLLMLDTDRLMDMGRPVPIINDHRGRS